MNRAIMLNFYVQLLNITLMTLSAPLESFSSCTNIKWKFMTERKTKKSLPTTKLSVTDKTINSNL